MKTCWLITLCLLANCTLFINNLVTAQPVTEKTDTTIYQVVYPQQDLKLWYGSDDFKVDHFVMLPTHTLLYNNNLSTFRLLSNKEMLVEDTYDLTRIKSILPYHVDSKKQVLGPVTTWFTVINDSTVQVGTVLFKGRNNVAGYLQIRISKNRLTIEHKPFILQAKEDGFDSPKTQFITNYMNRGNDQLFTSFIRLDKTDWRHYNVNASVYIKRQDNPLEQIYETPAADTSKRKPRFSPQLLATDSQLFIFDPNAGKIQLLTSDLTVSSVIDVRKHLPTTMPGGRRFGEQFLFDGVSNQLYYKVIYANDKGTDQYYMKATLTPDSINLSPVLHCTLDGFYGNSIQNHHLFFRDTNKGYIYMTKVELP